MQETILSREKDTSKDRVETALQNISQNIIVFVFGFLPLLFIPVIFIAFDYTKTIAVMIAILLSVIFFSLSVLRSGKVFLSAPLALFGLWGVAGATVLSTVLSGDMRDAFMGDDIGVHTSLFVILLALVATATSLIGLTKSTIMRLYVVLTGSAVLLGLFHVLRLIFGPEFLSLGIFTSLVSSPIGSWNDLGLFFGLSILLSLIALEQLPLTKWGKMLFSGVICIALIILAVVNFFAVWIVLGLVSLVVLMYSLTKDRFAEKTLTLQGSSDSVSLQSVVLSVLVFIVSLVFIIGGGAVGSSISKITGVSYLEVRPSFEATMEITRNVFGENAFVGIGPNKFVDAWRLYKDPSINQTVFWATDFKGASGYITTFFVTTGIVGIIAWAAFYALFLFAGFRMLFKSTHTDRFWYFIGSSSFVAAAYLWGMAVVYVPGAAMLLLAAIFTSVMFAAYSALIATKPFSFSIAANKRAGILLVGMVMVVIVGASSALYFIAKGYASVHEFGSALYGAQTGEDLKVVEGKIASAYANTNNDGYALQLASYQLAKMNALAGLPELTQAQQQELQLSIQNGINAGVIATNGDPTDSLYWSTLGSIYSVLAAASVEGAQDKAREAFVRAKTFDPTNPIHSLLEAQLDSRIGDLVGARARVQDAIALKSNYTDALFFLTQIDIAEGKTADAVATTRAIISLEPNNPARYYQLGVLQSANNDLTGAVASFKQAVVLDTNYANARYFLALALAQQNDPTGAIEQLEQVLALNPGNADVIALIERIRSGEPLMVTPQTSVSQVAEPETVSADDNAVITTQAPDTSLITPVNTPNEVESATETAQ